MYVLHSQCKKIGGNRHTRTSPDLDHFAGTLARRQSAQVGQPLLRHNNANVVLGVVDVRGPGHVNDVTYPRRLMSTLVRIHRQTHASNRVRTYVHGHNGRDPAGLGLTCAGQVHDAHVCITEEVAAAANTVQNARAVDLK